MLHKGSPIFTCDWENCKLSYYFLMFEWLWFQNPHSRWRYHSICLKNLFRNTLVKIVKLDNTLLEYLNSIKLLVILKLLLKYYPGLCYGLTTFVVMVYIGRMHAYWFFFLTFKKLTTKWYDVISVKCCRALALVRQ